MTENDSDLDMRTNCPYCKVDINSHEHDIITCLHESYGVYIQAQARIDAIENRLAGGEATETQTPQFRRRAIWERIRYDIISTTRELVIIIALSRFIFLGLGT